MNWFPKLPFGKGPRYLQITSALENDIATGKVSPGERLPTHRVMAEHLGLSVGTVSKAYAAAERRGLISGEVGRGTFVQRPTPDLFVTENTSSRGPINLALNAPPDTAEDQALAKVMIDVMNSDRLRSLMSYLPHQGRSDHRSIFADWISRTGMSISAEMLHITHGAQHAISIAMRLLVRGGAPVLAENLPYSGIMSLAFIDGYSLRGVVMDRHGLVPERLDEAFRETGAKVLYCTPTLQSATGALMPLDRRKEVAEIVRRHEAWIVEDDAYGFLCDDPVPTLSSLLPLQSFYIVSFAKCLSPGLRIGAMVTPPEFRDKTINAIRSTGWMANPIMAEAVAKLIAGGLLDEQIQKKRFAARIRNDLAKKILGSLVVKMSETPAFHTWMELPAGRTHSGLISQAAQCGVTVSSPTLLHPFDEMRNGIRLCLGGPESISDLEQALKTLLAILQDAETMSFV